ncbi:hypothetical protein [Candidatus Berkiella aquae]|uniref:Uncharacterized protein n=1 Tax=Candidatus Berkiella aquae TaxID=295108 RepID=A0A0Q9YV92_9GAMM|nr:hypothetical protein [Candidatus Berkiella aquae]MCS5711562.1 hypothetical protein [Candidatus Berkiella aquae]
MNIISNKFLNDISGSGKETCCAIFSYTRPNHHTISTYEMPGSFDELIRRIKEKDYPTTIGNQELSLVDISISCMLDF